MAKEIYFTTTSGKLVNNYDIAKVAIINGDTVDEYNFDDVRKYAATCKGIIKEINPSIKVCLRNGDRVTAIKLYYLRHPGIALKDARNAIDMIEAKMKVRREVQQLNKITSNRKGSQENNLLAAYFITRK